jgi:hypothetical protein
MLTRVTLAMTQQFPVDGVLIDVFLSVTQWGGFVAIETFVVGREEAIASIETKSVAIQL